MPNETLSHFPKLNDTNYSECNMQMEAKLVRRGLWGMIEIVVDRDRRDENDVTREIETKKSKRATQKLAEARAELILHVEAGQLAHMRSKDLMDIWETLRSVHCARGFATALALCRKFLTTKKKLDQSMQSWIGEIRSQAFTMEEVGIFVSNQDKILVLTMGLPPPYDPVIINFDSTPTGKLTLDNVIARLLNEEARQASAKTDLHQIPAANNPDNIAMTAAVPPRRLRATLTCHFCSKKGHFKHECTEREKWEALKKVTAAAAMDVEAW